MGLGLILTNSASHFDFQEPSQMAWLCQIISRVVSVSWCNVYSIITNNRDPLALSPFSLMPHLSRSHRANEIGNEMGHEGLLHYETRMGSCLSVRVSPRFSDPLSRMSSCHLPLLSRTLPLLLLILLFPLRSARLILCGPFKVIASVIIPLQPRLTSLVKKI